MSKKNLEILDKKLKRLEKVFTEKLLKFYSSLEKKLLKQYKNKTFFLSKSNIEKLKSLFIKYFKQVLKIANFYFKRLLKRDNINQSVTADNIAYAQDLAGKQINDFRDTIEKAVKDNDDIGLSIIVLIKAKALAFKNMRARSTAETMSNMIVNELAINEYTKSNIEKVRFTAVLDDRTSEICRPKDGLIFNIGSVELLNNTPPLHCYCRSYLVPVSY